MKKCWNSNLEKRPTFEALYEPLESLWKKAMIRKNMEESKRK